MSNNNEMRNNFEHDFGLQGQRTGRKRTRSCRSHAIYSSAIFALIVTSMNALVNPSNVFHSSGQRSRSHLLQAVRSPLPDTLQPVKPKSATSREKREEAIKAMSRDKVDSALTGVDAQMLEMLSDQFLFPSSNKPSEPSTRPRGRPEFVPGAMKYDTMVKYIEKKESDFMEIQKQRPTKIYGVVTNSDVKAERKKASSVKGSGANNEGKTLSDSSSENYEVKKRKRVVKNLPVPKVVSKMSTKRRNVSKGRSKVNNLELQKYYRTELLTAEEEYSLGIKVQLMVQCEQVHEGIAFQHMRLPSVEEWATACG
jgi:hypothetical protein